MDKITPEIVWYIALFLMPGFLMAFWVNVFVPLRPGTDNKNAFTYLFLSLLISLPILGWYGWHGWLPYLKSFHQLVWLVVYGLGASFLGAVLTSRIVHRPGKFPWSWLEKTGVRPLHPVASAWDQAFHRSFEDRTFDDPPFLLVTLKDGKQIGGKWDTEARASSDPNERDLLLWGTVYTVSEEGDWTPVSKTLGTLIKADQIATVDFIEPEMS